jgi:hypothetical protein
MIRLPPNARHPARRLGKGLLKADSGNAGDVMSARVEADERLRRENAERVLYKHVDDVTLRKLGEGAENMQRELRLWV